MKEQTYEEILSEYANWRKTGAYAQADIDCIIWWLKTIVWLVLILIKKQHRGESWQPPQRPQQELSHTLD